MCHSSPKKTERKSSAESQEERRSGSNTASISSSKKLQKEHCVDNICVSNVYIYYVDDRGEIKYTVENKSSSSKKGYLKMNFNGNEIYLNYIKYFTLQKKHIDLMYLSSKTYTNQVLLLIIYYF